MVKLKNGHSRRAVGRVLKPGDNHGYKSVCLSGRSALVHRLVAQTFLGRAPFEHAVVMHFDDDKGHNAASNLKWGTRQENARNAIPLTLEGRRRGRQQERPQTASTSESRQDAPGERWAPWPMHPAILVSTMGRVDRPRHGVRRLLRPMVTVDGYLRFGLSINGRTKSKLGHRLVLEAFRSDESGACARHLNNRKADNRLANLSWGTHAQNVAESVHERPNVLVANERVRTIWQEAETLTVSDLAERYGLASDVV